MTVARDRFSAGSPRPTPIPSTPRLLGGAGGYLQDIYSQCTPISYSVLYTCASAFTRGPSTAAALPSWIRPRALFFRSGHASCPARERQRRAAGRRVEKFEMHRRRAAVPCAHIKPSSGHTMNIAFSIPVGRRRVGSFVLYCYCARRRARARPRHRLLSAPGVRLQSAALDPKLLRP